MSQCRKFFGIVRRVESVTDIAASRGEAEPATTIHFEGGEIARLSGTDPSSAQYRSILEEAREARVPIYLVVEETTGSVTDLRVPLPTDAVTYISEVDDQTLAVELELSQLRHVLKRSNDDFERLRGALERALVSGSGVIVTETDDHEIIDVREAPFPFIHEEAPFGTQEDFRAAAPIPPSAADELFAMVSAKTCDARNPAAGCITFLFPDDGCYARAHEMCRIIGPASTGKVWIYGALKTRTRNHPNCTVLWRYHVATTVLVSTGAGTTPYVLDPSLFTKPVTIATWKGAQGDANAQTVTTDAEPFYRSPDGKLSKDPTYERTNEALKRFRLALKARSASPAGPPPYANCPRPATEDALA
ncbi:protein-glutamine glutaminase family protein [Azospirillum argentinense]